MQGKFCVTATINHILKSEKKYTKTLSQGITAFKTSRMKIINHTVYLRKTGNIFLKKKKKTEKIFISSHNGAVAQHDNSKLKQRPGGQMVKMQICLLPEQQQ